MSWNDDLDVPQYGTSMHWPYCQNRNCSGCLPPMLPPPIDDQPQLDLSLFRRDVSAA